MKYFAAVYLLFASLAVLAGVEYREFANPRQQEIYETLIKELRCLVCQNQTIADSNADLAADLRRQVHEMVQQGKSKEDIIRFLTDRYGDFVLYNPPFKPLTLLLWLGPLLFLSIGLISVFVIIRRKKTQAVAVLSAEQHEKIRSLLEEGDQS
ncbi:MAG: cytochrome c-type biogenesis protein [Gammaproteobacteria bacterium]